MVGTMKIIKSRQHKVRAALIDGETMFMLSDILHICGIKAADKWINRSNKRCDEVPTIEKVRFPLMSPKGRKEVLVYAVNEETGRLVVDWIANTDEIRNFLFDEILSFRFGMEMKASRKNEPMPAVSTERKSGEKNDSILAKPYDAEGTLVKRPFVVKVTECFSKSVIIMAASDREAVDMVDQLASRHEIGGQYWGQEYREVKQKGRPSVDDWGQLEKIGC